jgi:hypothetical protein
MFRAFAGDKDRKRYNEKYRELAYNLKVQRAREAQDG